MRDIAVRLALRTLMLIPIEERNYGQEIIFNSRAYKRIINS
jgi:hypothetical protein